MKIFYVSKNLERVAEFVKIKTLDLTIIVGRVFSVKMGDNELYFSIDRVPITFILVAGSLVISM